MIIDNNVGIILCNPKNCPPLAFFQNFLDTSLLSKHDDDFGMSHKKKILQRGQRARLSDRYQSHYMEVKD